MVCQNVAYHFIRVGLMRPGESVPLTYESKGVKSRRDHARDCVFEASRSIEGKGLQ